MRDTHRCSARVVPTNREVRIEVPLTFWERVKLALYWWDLEVVVRRSDLP